MLNELRRALAAASDELANLVDDEAAFAAKEAEIEQIRAKLGRAERAQAAAPALDVRAGMVPFNVAELGPGHFHRGTTGKLLLDPTSP